MDYERWVEEVTARASALLVAGIGLSILSFVLLHHLYPASVLYFFLSDLFHQILFYIGSVFALFDMFGSKLWNVAVERKTFISLSVFLLFIACFQAWTDEHRNSEELIRDKAIVVSDRDFWRSQSSSKDEALRSRDTLLSQNFTTLGKTQDAYNSITHELIETTKPEHLRIITNTVGVKAKDPTMLIVVAETNKRIPSFAGKLHCDQPFRFLQGDLATGTAYYQMRIQVSLPKTDVDFSFDGNAWDAKQFMVAIIQGQNVDPLSCRVSSD